MEGPQLTRYGAVSRRAMLKASLGAGAFALVPGLACGTDDAEIFAGAVADAPTTLPPTTTTPPTTVPPSTAPDTTAAIDTADATVPGVAVDGEMVISFTYTQAAGGKNEPPYVAVWIEDAAGELAATVALWFQTERRGERWLDHLSRWFGLEEQHLAGGGSSAIDTVSSATRAAGSYAVAWDGAIEGTPAPGGDYFVCIEAVREEGPYSLIREPFALTGSLQETPLPNEGELSDASVTINV